MIIDSHVHAGEAFHFTETFAAQMMAAVGQPRESMLSHIPTLLAEMDRAGVDKTFLLAFDAQRTLGVKVPNEYVAELCRAYPDRFVGFCSVDGGTPGASDTVYRCATELGMRGVKLAPAYVGLSPADRHWFDVYEVAQELGLPVLLHTGVTPIKQADRRFFPPMFMDEVAGYFPGVSFIMAHMGTPWVMSCIDLLHKHPNLYADISIFGWFQPIETVARTLAAARSKGVIDRLLWGTDYPMCSPADSMVRMERLRHDGSLFPDRQALSEGEWADLMGGTALRLIGDEALPQEAIHERVGMACAA